MSEHCPQPPNGFGWKPRSEHRNITLEIAADKVASPSKTCRITGREHALGKAAAQPQLIGVADLSGELQSIDRPQIHVRDSPSQ